MSALTGSVTGETLAEITTRATELAARFFGTECVLITLGEVRADPHGLATAGYVATEHHAVESRTYGPAKCRGCGRDSWPQSPLPQTGR